MSAPSTVPRVRRIVSGGQTGVDRAALDTAIAFQIEQGGWCPQDRRAEDGRIPDCYDLTETNSPSYPVRTRQNILDSDGTLILHLGQLDRGSELTWQLAEEYGKPYQVTDLISGDRPEPALHWIATHGIEVLNVAGPRESSHPGIGRLAAHFLRQLVRKLDNAAP